MTPCRYCPKPARPYIGGWLCPDHAPPPQPVPPCVAPIRHCGCGEHEEET